MKLTGMSLAERVRKALSGRRAITEKKMFGGTCFLLRSHMLCGTGKQGFMFRIGRAQHVKALARGARPVVMGGREFEGFVWVDPGSCDARALKRWIVLAEDYVGALPPKRKSR
ncbi:MAG TPA: TfoX/Sxy family protein [Burkholderiales bacterium]|jgi:TfoX/Sxy family transcriptional regulator of competence genes